jgi:hypothetical protein
MAILTAIMTHLDPSLVERQLAYLRSLSPGSRFVICHGGARADFAALTGENALYIDDPSLRGPHFDKSINHVLDAVYKSYVRDDPDVDLVYLIEYDHLILRGDFERKLAAMAEQSPAGLFAKHASARNDTNWSHYLKFRHSERLNRYITGISTRDDSDRRWGCLGTGMLVRREALAAFCALPDVPSYYVELFIPTVLYHLGFDIADVDALSDLYTTVRWLPEYSVDEAIAEKRAGRTFLHPFKQLDALAAVREAPGPASVPAAP